MSPTAPAPSSPAVPLWFRIGGLIALVVAFVVVLLSFLNYANFRKTMHGLTETRYLVLGKDARQTVEGGMALGLLPEQNTQLAVVFRDLAAKWPAVRFAGVVDTDGRVLVGSGEAADGARWRGPLRDSKLDGVWHSRAEHDDAVGLTLENNFGDKAGAVVIRYDDRETRQASAGMAQALAWRAAAVSLCAALLAWAGAWWLTRPLAAELDEAMTLLASNKPPSALLTPLQEATLLGGTAEFIAAAHNAADTIARGTP
jgi:hypothetical protein